MVKKKSNKILGVVSLFILLFILGGGIYLFLTSGEQSFIQSGNDGFLLQAIFYNQAGDNQNKHHILLFRLFPCQTI